MQPSTQTYSQQYDELEKHYLLLNLKDIVRKSLRLIKPKLKIDIIKWAEDNIVLPDTTPIPGPFRIKNSPHLLEILRACVDPEVREVSIMGCSQFGKTLLYSIIWSYYVDNDPSPMLIAHPTDSEVKSFALHKLEPLIDASPILYKKIAKRKKGGTTEDSSTRVKMYPGGWTEIINLTAKGKTRQRTVKRTIADDIDALDVTASSEGDHLFNLEKRTTGYKYDYLHINVSVPHISGSSNIEVKFNAGTREYFNVRCPHCKKEQMFDDDNITWETERRDLLGHEVENKPETAKVSCTGCNHQFTEKERIDLLQSGFYKAKYPNRKTHRSFHLGQISSTLTSLENIAKEKIKAMAALEQGDDEKWESYVNSVKGIPYKKIVATETDAKILIDRREDYIDPKYPKIIPNGVLLLTAFVDAQAGSQIKPPRFEYEVWGWGYAEECWIVDKGIEEGSPEDIKTRERLKQKILSLTYIRKDGLELGVKRVGYDSGFATQSIYELCERMAPKGWYATKGANRYGAPLLPRKISLVNKNKTILLTIGSQACKGIMYERLNTISDSGPKRIHHTKLFCDVEYFDQLTAEHAIQKTVGLMQIIIYDKKKAGIANEAVDLWCGAYAMMKSLNVNWKKFKAHIDEKVGALSNEQLTGDESQQGKEMGLKETVPKSPVLINKPSVQFLKKKNKIRKRTGINTIVNY